MESSDPFSRGVFSHLGRLDLDQNNSAGTQGATGILGISTAIVLGGDSSRKSSVSVDQCSNLQRFVSHYTPVAK